MSVIMLQGDDKRDALQPTPQCIDKPLDSDEAMATGMHSSDSDSEAERKVENDDDELRLDPKETLIIKDGTIKVAHPYREPEPQYDANGELIKASGTWTQVEHDRFLKAIQTYPKGPWKAIAAMVGSRTVRQTQTHAQKYREKMARRLRGLRNRNGTLQTPPMRLSQLVATSPVYGHPVMPSVQYAHRPHSLGMNTVEYIAMPRQYVTSSPTQSMAEMPHSLRPTIPSDMFYAASHGFHQIHHFAPPHTHVATPQSVSMDYEMSYKQVNEQQGMLPPKTPTGASADLQPTPWSETSSKMLIPTPDYNESMDFLMNFYAIDPTHPAAHAHLLQAQEQHYASTHGLNQASHRSSP